MGISFIDGCRNTASVTSSKDKKQRRINSEGKYLHHHYHHHHLHQYLNHHKENTAVICVIQMRHLHPQRIAEHKNSAIGKHFLTAHADTSLQRKPIPKIWLSCLRDAFHQGAQSFKRTFHHLLSYLVFKHLLSFILWLDNDVSRTPKRRQNSQFLLLNNFLFNLNSNLILLNSKTLNRCFTSVSYFRINIERDV